MVFLDYKVVETQISGQNSNNERVVYTTEYPCIMWCEIEDGQVPGFNQRKFCYYDIAYTGDQSFTARTYIFGGGFSSAQFPAGATSGTVTGYCRKAGIPVIFDTGDDDYSGTIRIHIARLPDRAS